MATKMIMPPRSPTRTLSGPLNSVSTGEAHRASFAVCREYVYFLVRMRNATMISKKLLAKIEQVLNTLFVALIFQKDFIDVRCASLNVTVITF